MRGAAIATAMLVSALAAPADAALPGEQPYRIDYGGRIATDVYIDGQGPFRFIIDTASSRSLIFEPLRARLALGPSQPAALTVYGINGIANAMPVRPTAITIAGETIGGLTLGVLPGDAGGPDGVLGTDILSRYVVVLDRTAMQLRLLPPGTDTARRFADWNAAPLIPRGFRNLPVVFWYLSPHFDAVPFTALFDLGAGFTMINWPAAEKLGLHQSAFTAQGPPPDQLRDVLGKRAPAVRLTGLRVTMPGRSWKNQFAVVADAPIFDYFDLDERPAAIVGLGLLADNSLAIDFQRGRLYVGPTAEEDANKKGGASAAPSAF